MTRLLPRKKGLEKGQAVLVVLLVMVVLLTLGLSVVSRSVTDVKISQQSQESARAFWTAQAGLEKALLAQGVIPLNTVDGVSYAVTKTALGGSSIGQIDQGKSFVYWLVNHNPDGSIGTTFYSGDNLTIYWGNSGDSSALTASLVYKDTSGLFRSRKFAFDPSTTRSPNFSSPDLGTGHSFGGNIFAYKATISGLSSLLPNYDKKPYFVNIKMLFNTTAQPIGVQMGVDFVQGYCYESTATVNVSNIVRKLKECRTWPQTPEIFDYLLFSGEDI